MIHNIKWAGFFSKAKQKEWNKNEKCMLKLTQHEKYYQKNFLKKYLSCINKKGTKFKENRVC